MNWQRKYNPTSLWICLLDKILNFRRHSKLCCESFLNSLNVEPKVKSSSSWCLHIRSWIHNISPSWYPAKRETVSNPLVDFIAATWAVQLIQVGCMFCFFVNRIWFVCCCCCCFSAPHHPPSSQHLQLNGLVLLGCKWENWKSRKV